MVKKGDLSDLEGGTVVGVRWAALFFFLKVSNIIHSILNIFPKIHCVRFVV